MSIFILLRDFLYSPRRVFVWYNGKMEKLFIPLVLGTAREGRESEKVARFVFRELEKNTNIETVFVDVRDHVVSCVTLPPWGSNGVDEKPTEWKKIAARANAFIFVLPEYNHGYPGEWKLLLDSLYDEYAKKPVGLCGVSSGVFGGARMIDLVKPTLVEVKMVPLRTALYFGNIKNAFDETGEPMDKQVYTRMRVFFDDLLWYAEALKVR